MLRRDIRYQAAIIQNDQVLLLQMRSQQGDVFWLPPGGGREGNETPEECLKREMREETELEVRVERLLFTQPGIPGNTYDQLHTYLCRPISGTARAGSEPEMASMPALDIQGIAWFDLYDSSTWPPPEDMGKITLAWLDKLRMELSV